MNCWNYSVLLLFYSESNFFHQSFFYFYLSIFFWELLFLLLKVKIFLVTFTFTQVIILSTLNKSWVPAVNCMPPSPFTFSNRSFSNRASDKRLRCFVRISEAVLRSLSAGEIVSLYYILETTAWLVGGPAACGFQLMDRSGMPDAADYFACYGSPRGFSVILN